MGKYTIFLRSFAPWDSFGGVLPQSSDGYSGGQFAGDSRGFSVHTDSSTTARVNLQFSVDVTHGVVSWTKLWCDPSFGPFMMLGVRVGDRGKPKATITSFKDGSAVVVSAGYTGANPLVPTAPAIGARGDYRLTHDSQNNVLSVETKISGDQFPACESFIDDGSGHHVFLGGFSPESKMQVLRLYGQLNKPDAIYFKSSVTLSVNAYGAFDFVRGTWGNQLSPPPPAIGPRISIHDWNRSVMRTIPLPSDAPSAQNSP